MKRIHIHIEDTQAIQLKVIAKATRKSVGYLIRAAIDTLVAQMLEAGVVQAAVPLRAQKECSVEEIRKAILPEKAQKL